MSRAAVLGAGIVLAAAGALAASSHAERSPADGPADGRLVVTERIIKSNGTYIEGAYQYLRLARPDGAVVFKRRYGKRMKLDRRFPAGRYRLSSYTRTCAGTCAYLDRPSARCARSFTLERGGEVRAVVRTKAGERCRIRFRR
jgi:hypothetical protein